MHYTAEPDLHSNVLHSTALYYKVRNIEGAGPSKKKQARISQVKNFVAKIIYTKNVRRKNCITLLLLRSVMHLLCSSST